MARINARELFRSPSRFPWEWIGHDRPKVGMTHSYLCTILARWTKNEERRYLESRPSWRELRRYAELYGGFAADIVSYCERIYDEAPSDRRDRAHEVLGFLGRAQFVVDFIQEKLDNIYFTE